MPTPELVRIVVRMKLRLGFRTSTTQERIFTTLLMLVGAGGMVAGIVGIWSQFGEPDRGTRAMLALAAVSLGWLFVTIVFGGGEGTLDPARFAPFPITDRQLVAALFVAAFLGAPAAATAIVTLATASYANSLLGAVVMVCSAVIVTVTAVLSGRVGITAKTEIIILGEVSPADAVELSDYPTVLHQIDPDRIDDIYMTPPLEFPDGRHCVKLGANTDLDTWPASLDEIQRWFASDTDPDHLPILQPALQALWPDVEFVSFRTKPCIVTYTPDHMPLIDEIAPGLVVATAGNGAGAKGADAWGAEAAQLVLRSA